MTILTTREAAARCGLSASYLHKSRVRGDGPPFLKVGRRAVRYDAAKLDTWLTAHERRSTSERLRPATPTTELTAYGSAVGSNEMAVSTANRSRKARACARTPGKRDAKPTSKVSTKAAPQAGGRK